MEGGGGEPIWQVCAWQSIDFKHKVGESRGDWVAANKRCGDARGGGKGSVPKRGGEDTNYCAASETESGGLRQEPSSSPLLFLSSAKMPSTSPKGSRMWRVLITELKGHIGVARLS